MIIKMQITLVWLCIFHFSFIGAAEIGDGGGDGVSAGGIYRGDLVQPDTKDGERAAGEITSVGEFQIDIQGLVGLDGGIDGFYADLRFATAVAFATGQPGNRHRYQYSGYQERRKLH